MLAKFHWLSRGLGLGGLFWILLLAGSAQEHDEKKVNIPESLVEVLESIRKDRPEAFGRIIDSARISGILLEDPRTWSAPEQRWQAKLIAADLLEAAGDEREAREIRLGVLREGQGPEERARAAFQLGLGYFLRERYESADTYWKVLPQIAPESIWTRRAGRFQPYLEMLRNKAVPRFEAEFGEPGKAPSRRSDQDLRGRWTVLCFWGSEVPGIRDAARSLESMAKKLTARRGASLEILGVNLDSSREKFEASVRDWGLGWPQHCDGQGFQGPLARAFGIPRLPHWVLVDPEGKLVYAGSRLNGGRSVESSLLPPLKAPPEEPGKAGKSK